ncbi:MAG: hypothetical protein CMO55_07710 [Verrucomicrobiales bacterium]|nr:hypothetical protein [Verrucomicrobiales bacterium]
MQPVFIRLPKPGTKCPHTGLSRSELNELILGDNPKVRSIDFRKPGNSRGIRLIVFRSLVEFLFSFEKMSS